MKVVAWTRRGAKEARQADKTEVRQKKVCIWLVIQTELRFHVLGGLVMNDLSVDHGDGAMVDILIQPCIWLVWSTKGSGRCVTPGVDLGQGRGLGRRGERVGV